MFCKKVVIKGERKKFQKRKYNISSITEVFDKTLH